jgi:hypothetical protein
VPAFFLITADCSEWFARQCGADADGIGMQTNDDAVRPQKRDSHRALTDKFKYAATAD